MMNAIAENGLPGLTAVGDSHDDAMALYQKTAAVLDEEAGRA